MITVFDDLVIEPHRLFHISPKSFDFPCRQKINEAREWSRWHPNGVLGLWCSTFPARCSAFGLRAYEIVMREGHRTIGIPYSEFQRLTSDMEDYTDLIAFLCERGDIAYIVDANPYVGEVIVLNFDAIETFTDVTGQELRDTKCAMSSAQDEALHN